MSVEWWVRMRTHPDLPICHDCLAGLNGQRDGQVQLMTGSWLATGFEPIFRVADMARSVAWFENAGFDVSLHDGAYAFAHRNRDLTIHLARTPGSGLPGRAGVYIHCQDADRVAEEWRRVGIEVDGPRDEEYGKREGSVTDPDGNLIRFGSPIR
jgi:catechol 2,3-dioxygenase-like lactoylglutathione lyase family enzyme